MKKLIIVGASGHGKVVADIACKTGYEEIVFLDDNPDVKECSGFPVVGSTDKINEIDGYKFIAVGNNRIRERLSENTELVTLIHPGAVISRNVTIGKGTVIMAGAVINSDAVIGNGCIINTGATVDHDCNIQDYTHISVGSHVAGTVNIGKRVWLGIGSIVSNNLNICDDAYIGAGSVIVKDIFDNGVYYGVPAVKKKEIG